MELPPLSVQRKFVAIYKAMVANQRSYEQGLDDLKLVADAMIEKYKHTTKRMSLGELLQECDIRNSDNVVAEVDGVNKDKKFMPSIASGDDLSKYKLVEQGFFACNLMHIGRDVVVPIALNNADEFRLVSPAYMVLKTKGNNVLPEFVLMWMSRGETDRRAWFMSDSSVRSGMEKRRFFEITVPVPPIEEQKALVEIHKVLDQRKNINEQMKSQIKEICPVLIRGSLEYGG
jgi:type I restriction enzyme S subunit